MQYMCGFLENRQRKCLGHYPWYLRSHGNPVPFDGILSSWCVSCTAQLCVICSGCTGSHCVIDKNIKRETRVPKQESWGTALVTSLHLDTETLTTTFQLYPSSQFLFHWTVYPANLSLSKYTKELSRRKLPLKDTNEKMNWFLFIHI